MHAARASRTSCRTTRTYSRRYGRGTRLHAPCVPHAHDTPHPPYDRTLHIAHWHGPLFWHLLCVKQSSAASHKCHYCVRHFGRVFISPYKTPSTPLAAQCDAACISSLASCRFQRMELHWLELANERSCTFYYQNLKVCLVHRALWLLELMICCNASITRPSSSLATGNILAAATSQSANYAIRSSLFLCIAGIGSSCCDIASYFTEACCACS